MHQNHNKYLTLNVLLFECREQHVAKHDDAKIRAMLETALHVLDGPHHESCPEPNPTCTCGTRISPHHEAGCPSADTSSAPAQYTWEQAEAGMRRGEIWAGSKPEWDHELQFCIRSVSLFGKHQVLFSRTEAHDEWMPVFDVVNIRECTWRPYPGAQG